MAGRTGKGSAARVHASEGVFWQRAREDAGLEQQAAAQQLAIHPVTLSRYETGAREIPRDVVERMTRLYRVAPAPPMESLAYWSGRQDQMLEHLKRMVEEQTRLADDLRRAAFGAAVPTPPRSPAIPDVE